MSDSPVVANAATERALHVLRRDLSNAKQMLAWYDQHRLGESAVRHAELLADALRPLIEDAEIGGTAIEFTMMILADMHHGDMLKAVQKFMASYKREAKDGPQGS